MLSIYQVFELGGTSFGVTFFLSGITELVCGGFLFLFCFSALRAWEGFLVCWGIYR